MNPWADRVNAAFWYREWIGEVKRILKPSGCLWSFLNWRSLVTFQKAADDLGWPIESLLVWDKGMIGTGSMKGLRPCYEFVALWAGKDFAIENRSLRDIQQFKWQSVKPTGHPAEKPLALIEFLIRHSTRPGDRVVDIFAGSGTTGVACVSTGRDFTGSEIDPNWHKYAEYRITQAQAALLETA